MAEDWWNLALRYYAKVTDPVYAKRYMKIKRMEWGLTEIAKGELILDVGSGKPIDAIRFSWLGAYSVALDLSVEDLTSGKRFMKKELPEMCHHVGFIVAGATILPFRPRTFDVVVSYSAIEHLADSEKHEEWVNEMARVARNGAKVVLTTENKLNLLCLLLNAFRILDYGKIRRPHLLSVPGTFVMFWLSKRLKSFKRHVPKRSDYFETFFSPRGVEELLSNAGLTVKTFDSSTLYYWGYAPPLLAFSNFALKVDNLLNKFESVKCLKIFGKVMGFGCVKGRRVSANQRSH